MYANKPDTTLVLINASTVLPVANSLVNTNPVTAGAPANSEHIPIILIINTAAGMPTVDAHHSCAILPDIVNIQLTTASILTQTQPAIILFAFENEHPKLPASLRPLLSRLTKDEFSGKDGQFLLLHTAGKAGIKAPRLLLVGLGKHDDLTREKTRRAFGNALKKLRDAGITRAAVQINCPAPGATIPIIESAILAGYRFTKFKPANNHKPALDHLTLCLPAGTDLKAARATATKTQIIAESANYTREIANLPGNVVYPEVLADHARQLAEEVGLKCTILDKPALEAGGYGGILAVGSGSARDPRLIVLEYAGTTDAKPIALVGKALTFDSGGISIKPSDKMDEMKFDKCGGVAVLGAMRAIAKLQLPLNVIGIIGAAENMPSATSYRPGDIVTSYKGTDKTPVTIEVLNTDAEGRIVLGDALVYARQRDPQAIIDLATLTGACVIALGTYAAGLLGNDDALIAKIRAAGDTTGERVWPFPLWQEYKDKIKSDVADIKNTGGREGGVITAAAFLAKYVGDVPWAHIDIAGTAWTTEEKPYLSKGATGFGVRLLLDLLSDWQP
jgi:leucyl aminopeptidase